MAMLSMSETRCSPRIPVSENLMQNVFCVTNAIVGSPLAQKIICKRCKSGCTIDQHVRQQQGRLSRLPANPKHRHPL